MPNRPSHKITYSDLIFIIGNAKNNYVSNTLPMAISKKRLDVYEPTHVAMIESVLMYLDSKGLTSSFIKMDYDEKFDLSDQD